ncbi:MAG TPA: hypothetical protein VFN13_14225 [Rudaea sp.]|nr:hypothetical protein [Rudaea sp.]
MIASRICCTLALLVVSIAAQAFDAASFQDLHWRLVGPFRGGRVLAVAGVPGTTQHFYFGSVNGGVWETHDAGRTWKPIFDAQPVGSIGAIAVAPSDPRVIYVGTGEADMRSDIAQGDGVYKSIDGGKTWAFSGLRDSQQIGRILVDPDDADHVFVAALGHPYGPNAQRGVFASHDGGKTWKKILGPNADTGAINMAFEPGNAKVIYAALWQTRRPPWNVYPPSNGPGSGLYKTSDGGAHWTHLVGHGFPSSVARVGIALSPAAPQRVYAIVDGDAGGLYRSDDGGANWTKTTGDARLWGRGWYFGELTIDPKNPDRIFVLNTIMLRSDDGGAHFIALKGDPTGDDFHALWIDPSDPQRQILAVDQGAQITLNGGKTWSTWHNQPTAQIYHISTDNRFPYWVYGSQQDSGAIGLPSRGPSHDGITLREFNEVAVGGESDNVAPDPNDPDIVFGGRVDKLDRRTQQIRNVDPTLALPDVYRGVWTLPLTFSTLKPHDLYFGNQHVFRTSDGGEHWQRISPDLTRPNPIVPKTLDAPTVADNLGQGPRRGVVYAIAPSPLAEGVVWAGTDDGLIWRTRDDGANWDNITPKALGSWSKVGIIDASPFDADSAYVAVDRHRVDDFKPYIYRTHDAGKTWQAIVMGLPGNQPINVVRADPKRRGLLYAGSERGVFVSFDDGDHWQSLQQNLPATSVRDIAIHDADLVIATHGRGIWILDDASALRQLNAKVEQAAAWLYAPAPAYRVRTPDFTGTPLPKDEPMAANPAQGAYIDYTLKTTAKSSITLDILDANDKLVRHYSSADHVAAPDPAKLHAAPEWSEIPSTLSTAAGMHRFVWPLHYPALPVAGKSEPYAEGVWAPPGKYRVVLSVDGSELSQPLSVLPDPRVHIPAEAYARQFTLAREIEQSQAQIASAAHGAGKWIQALDDALGKAHGQIAKDIATTLGQLRKIAGTHASVNPSNAWSFPPTGTHNFRFIATWLSKFEQAVDGADAMPSPDVEHGITALQPIINATLESWSQFQSHTLAALNVSLRKAGLKPIAIDTK